MVKGQNNEEVLSYNRSLIVQYLQRVNVCTRSQLSKALRLTPASISKTIAKLIENGLVEETGFILGEKGRRSIGITLKKDMFKVIGVRLSRRNYAVGVFDLTGENISTRSEAFGDGEEINDVLDKIKNEIHQYLEKYDDIVAVGAAVPGPYFEKEGRVILITDTKGWNEVNLLEYFADIFSIPIIIRHDANSGALAEWWLGNQNGSNDKKENETLVYYLVGEGVGAGVVVGGNVFGGSNGTAAEIGHISLDVNGPRCDCGNYGCLELYCSSLNFVKHAKAQLLKHPDSSLNRYGPLTFQAIFDEAKMGDELAAKLVRRVGKYIGYGAVTLINAYNPNIILIGSDMAGGGDLLLEAVDAIVRERVPDHVYKNVKIELSWLKGDPILYGAAAVAMDYCLQNPELLLVKA